MHVYKTARKRADEIMQLNATCILNIKRNALKVCVEFTWRLRGVLLTMDFISLAYDIPTNLSVQMLGHMY